MKNVYKQKKEQGFTIIEVMIVLAIAGLILAIIFLAVPGLRRNANNNSRRNDVTHFLGLMNEYAANNQGSIPTAFANGTGAAAGTMYLNNEKFSIMTMPPAAPAAVPGALPTPALDTLLIYTPATCSGNTPISGGGSRSYVGYFEVEGAGGNVAQCIGG
jgi:prepilin-type N-terminal cleavage/methylation domain-containing protein